METSAIQDKTRVNAWWDNRIGNDSMVSEWKENFRLPQPNPNLFWWYFVSCCQGNKQLVNHFIMNVSAVVVVCKQSGSEYPFSVNTYKFKYSKIGES